MPKYDSEMYGQDNGPVVYQMGSLGGVVTIGNGLFAAVIITALARNEHSAITAILTGGAYYGVSTLMVLLVLSGSLTRMVINRQEQVTLRHFHELQTTVERLTASRVDPLQLPGTPAVDRLPGPLGGSTYVAPADLTTQRDAALWAVSLYGSDGAPDPAKINLKSDRERPGRLRVAAPASNLREWLLTKRVLERVDHGYRLNIARYPNAETLRDILNS